MGLTLCSTKSVKVYTYVLNAIKYPVCCTAPQLSEASTSTQGFNNNDEALIKFYVGVNVCKHELSFTPLRGHGQELAHNPEKYHHMHMLVYHRVVLTYYRFIQQRENSFTFRVCIWEEPVPGNFIFMREGKQVVSSLQIYYTV